MYSHLSIEHTILSSEFSIFIHNGRNYPILDYSEKEIIRISLHTSRFR